MGRHSQRTGGEHLHVCSIYVGPEGGAVPRTYCSCIYHSIYQIYEYRTEYGTRVYQRRLTLRRLERNSLRACLEGLQVVNPSRWLGIRQCNDIFGMHRIGGQGFFTPGFTGNVLYIDRSVIQRPRIRPRRSRASTGGTAYTALIYRNAALYRNYYDTSYS